MAAVHFQEKILTVHHWTENQFSFTATRNSGFRFLNGQFTMIGIEVEGKPIMRAYSMVSTNYDEHLEFLSIKVQNGPLTSRLQHVKPGDELIVNSKAVGTLILQNLIPGKRLYLMSTGTGLAPFMSVIRDPETYEHFEQVILVHGCREVKELAYHEYIGEELPKNEYFGELVSKQLKYYPTVTREAFRHQGRVTTLFESGEIAKEFGFPAPNIEEDRVMICGNPDMNVDCRKILKGWGWSEGNMGEPGHFVVERAFVDK